MQIDFLNSDSNTQNVCELLAGDGPFKLAVAFLGEQSESVLKGIKGKAQIVCNLESGATNPFAIEALLKRRDIEIRNHEKLHAKVYWTPYKAIVTSANLSANGLSYEDDELSGWHEAGVAIVNDAVNKSIQLWFDALWERSQEISAADIEAAKVIWKRRRNCISRTPKRHKGSLFEVLRQSPASFKDRRIYFAIWTEDADERDKQAARDAVANGVPGLTEKNFDLYVDWDELPEDAQLINFKLSGDRVTNIEMTKSFPKDDHHSVRGYKNSKITLTQYVSHIDGTYSLSAGDKKLLRKMGRKLWDGAGVDESARSISLFEAKDILFGDKEADQI